MTKQQEFRKQTEEAKFEVFSLMCKKVADLEKQIEKMKCCFNCSKDCGSINRRICFENKMKDWVMKE